MPSSYRILDVNEKTREVKTNYGTMLAYTFSVLGEDGFPVEVQMLQKMDTPAPLEGAELYGHIEDTPFGFRFKKDQHPDSPRPAGSSSKPPTSISDDLDRQRMIIRQSALKAAVDLTVANGLPGSYRADDVIALAKVFARYSEIGE